MWDIEEKVERVAAVLSDEQDGDGGQDIEVLLGNMVISSFQIFEQSLAYFSELSFGSCLEFRISNILVWQKWV